MKRCFWIYMLECDNGSYYTGMADDLAKRYGKHLRGTSRAKYLRSFRPIRIAQCWKLFGTKGDAMRVERLIKSMDRKEKEEIIHQPDHLHGLLQSKAGQELTIFSYNPVSIMNEVEGKDSLISEYCITEYDRSMFNPYLREIEEIVKDRARGTKKADADLLVDNRTYLTTKYSFSIPTSDLLMEIASYSPIVEIGAGSGYWAMCLYHCGADILAYDLKSPAEEMPYDPLSGNQWFDDVWHPVQEGDHSVASLHPERSLFLCWPPFEDPMAYRSLTGYLDAEGGIVIYIGDPSSTGDRAFHVLLKSLRCIARRRVPGWPAIREELVIARQR